MYIFEKKLTISCSSEGAEIPAGLASSWQGLCGRAVEAAAATKAFAQTATPDIFTRDASERRALDLFVDKGEDQVNNSLSSENN